MPEKTYCFQVLLGEMLGLDYTLRVREGASHYVLRLPNGAALEVEDHFFGRFRAGGDAPTYLQMGALPTDVRSVEAPFPGLGDIALLYGNPRFSFDNQQIVCGVDLFAATFFMLSRWEEHVRPERDQHGRFPAAASTALRHGFLDRPVVDEWAALLGRMLERLGYRWQRPRRQYALDFSCDVDHPRLWWSPWGRLRSLAGSLRRERPGQALAYWLKNHVFQARDPYDVFDDWMGRLERAGWRGQFNFLGERAADSDCYYPLGHPFVQDLVQKIAQRGHVVGFHPSYEAHEDAGQFGRELESLRRCLPAPVQSGRQHYLRFSAPDTWRRWAEAGLLEDGTLGYAEAEGFRCGMCRDFPVFDFLRRETLPLRERPLVAMDVTLAHYQGYDPETGLARLLALQAQVQKHAGSFSLLWHNSSWNSPEWQAWQPVLAHFLPSLTTKS